MSQVLSQSYKHSQAYGVQVAQRHVTCVILFDMPLLAELRLSGERLGGGFARRALVLSSPNKCSHKRTWNKIKLNGRAAPGPAYTMSPVAVCGMIYELLAKDPDHNEDSTSTFQKDGEQKHNVTASSGVEQPARPSFWQHDRGCTEAGCTPCQMPFHAYSGCPIKKECCWILCTVPIIAKLFDRLNVLVRSYWAMRVQVHKPHFLRRKQEQRLCYAAAIVATAAAYVNKSQSALLLYRL
jgi:hypothetical protein